MTWKKLSRSEEGHFELVVDYVFVLGRESHHIIINVMIPDQPMGWVSHFGHYLRSGGEDWVEWVVMIVEAGPSSFRQTRQSTTNSRY